MSDIVALSFAIIIFLGFGYALNSFSESVYWWWHDWRDNREDQKMLNEQEKTEKNIPDNVVKLDEVRKKVTHYVDYGDDTIH